MELKAPISVAASRVERQMMDHDIGARGVQGARRCGTQAACTTGNQYRLSGQGLRVRLRHGDAL